ncbi:MAG: hypothetical protein KHZ90_09725 [Veillonella parvula]|uniref:Uncharacterized protein n=1 Tax=Veillonella parvula TaxID=29466 RepID=A0A942WW22_VEIPA|nr:hypothetical protein [Veillonella parvula]MBS4894034.1 hypothetical protein [Veillonella parvula]
MSLRRISIKNFKENEFYHLATGERSIDKSRVYFIKDDVLYELEMMGEPKVSNDPYNFINKASFVIANVSLNMEQLPRWTKVDALIDGEWVKRYFYSYKGNIAEIKDAGSLGFLSKSEILVTPCYEEMFDVKYLEHVESIIFDEKDRYKALTWS